VVDSVAALEQQMTLKLIAVAIILLAGQCFVPAAAQEDQTDSSQYVKQLASVDPSVRRNAAEALAKLVAVEQKKVVEGYLLQEKDKRVRLALNWALYRMGKSELLYAIVKELDSSRHDQATDYLSQLERPDALYVFLKQDNTPFKVRVRVIEVLGEIGDSETLNQLKPLNDAFEPELSDAAKTSTKQIEARLAQPEPDVKSRPRIVHTSERPPL
jgi:hypothetical protein